VSAALTIAGTLAAADGPATPEALTAGAGAAAATGTAAGAGVGAGAALRVGGVTAAA
jgi:hypothetical protein